MTLSWTHSSFSLRSVSVQCGTTMTLGPVKELATDGRFTIIQFDTKALGIMMVLSAVGLLARIVSRFGKR